MTTTYIGELTLGAIVPLPVALVSQAQFMLEAQISATLQASIGVQLPTSLAQLLALAQSILQALEGLLLDGIEPPSVTAQGAIFASVLAQIGLQLAPFLAFATLMAAGGVFAYTYSGDTDLMGADLGTALSLGFPGHAPNESCNALILGTVSAGTWAAMQQLFGI